MSDGKFKIEDGIPIPPRSTCAPTQKALQLEAEIQAIALQLGIPVEMSDGTTVYSIH